MGAPSSRQSRMAIDTILNPSSSSSSSVESYPDPMGYCRLQYPTSPSRPPYPPHQHHHHHYHPDQGYRPPYSEYSRASSSSYSQGPLITRSTESSPSPYSRDRYDSVSSSSSVNAPTTASRASISSSATSVSTAAAAAAAATTTTTTGTGVGAADRRRPPRPKYEEEEMYFIWYHRVDLCQEWKEVRESFNRQFPKRQRSGFQGIQCKFYRFIRDKRCPTLREQRRMRDGEFLHEGQGQGQGQGQTPSPVSELGPPKFGVIEWMGIWYPWMRESREQAMKRIST